MSGSGEINFDLVRWRIKEVKDAIDAIREYTSSTIDDFLADNKLVDSTKCNFLTAVEGVSSICNRIAVRVCKKVPESYGECFRILGDAKIISKDLVPRLMNMAKFRDLLVHLYWKVDNSKVYAIAKTNLNDLSDYVKEIGGYLGRELQE